MHRVGLRLSGGVLSPLFGIVHAVAHYRTVEDVLGRVHVRVRPMPAVATVEHRLAFTVLTVAIPTRMTGLGRVRRGHFDEPSARELGLVGESITYRAPFVRQDAAVQSRFRPRPVGQVPLRIGRISAWFRAARHVRHVKVFDGDHVVVPHQLCRDLRCPIGSAVGFMLADTAHSFKRALTILRREFRVFSAASLVGPVLSGQLPLQPLVFVPLLRGRLRHVEERTVGQGERVRASPVHSDRRSGCRTVDGQRLVGEHEGARGPVDGDARVGSDRLADAYVDGQFPS